MLVFSFSKKIHICNLQEEREEEFVGLLQSILILIPLSKQTIINMIKYNPNPKHKHN